MSEPFEPVFSGFYHTRGQRSQRRFSLPHLEYFFPARHTIDNGTSGWGNLHTNIYNPVHPPLRDGIPYEDLITCFYNVKTWRFAGEVGGFTFDYTVPAGCLGTYDDDVDPVVSDRPNEEKRGIYCAQFSYDGRTVTDTTEETGSVSVGIGTGSASSPVGSQTPQEVINPSATNPYIFVPYLDIEMTHAFYDDNDAEAYFSRTIKATPQATTAPAEDINITFLGLSLHTHPLDAEGPPTSYSLAITADAYWSSTDPWVTSWP